MEFIKTYENFLSNDECDVLLKFSLENLSLYQAEVITDTEKYKNSRKSKVDFYDYNKNFPFLIEKVLNHLNENVKIKGHEIIINPQKEKFQFTEYKEGDYYDWHTDSFDNPLIRYCSMVIQLNDGYEGGELEIIDNERVKHVMENGKGNLYIFSSSLEHRVKPVLKNTRYSLVYWFSLKPNDNLKKTLL